MTVFGAAAITKFGKKHHQARKPLARFLAMAQAAEWRHLPDVKESFPAVDYVAKSQIYIFDIGGNKYRLVAEINFPEQSVLIRAVLTHEEYDEEEL